jgi:2-polyprenyl-6-methoxyphenol hydroxylase-like FAD-dependent oxidoreductase
MARTGLVLGGGLAGTLAAMVLAGHVDEVTIVERDRLPAEPLPRKGVPQGRHVHALVAGGARALDELLPGATDAMLAAGAHRLGMPGQFLIFGPNGWWPRSEREVQFVISGSRALIDWVVRERVLRDPAISVREHTDVLGLTGDPTRVRGARLRDRDSGIVEEVAADFVVDATGRGSSAAGWLAALGLPAADEDVVDPGVAYVTRMFTAPAEFADGFLSVNIQADPSSPEPGMGGVLNPIEGGRWLVTMAGMRGAEPPLDDTGFTAFARKLRHPLIADLISAATPLTEPYGYRTTANRRRRYERVSPWPQGFAVLGDASCTFNPIYGHGMATVARSALALRSGLRRHGLAGAQQIQRAIAAAANDAWSLAVSLDVRYPRTIGPKPGRLSRLRYRYGDRLATVAGNPVVARAQFDVLTLSAPAWRLLTPRMVLEALTGPRAPWSTEPPFTPEERRRLPVPTEGPR